LIGIVANKMVEALARPAILIAVNEDLGTARGSARSIEGYHIFEALSACGPLLLRCGGHQGAAGFEFDPTRLDDLRARLREIGESTLPTDLLQPRLHLDAELAADDLTLDLARLLAQLEPFGNGNPQPVFLSRSLPVRRQLRIAGKGRAGVDHLKLFLAGPNGRPLEAIAWRSWNRAGAAPEGAALDLCYSLDVNRYNGTEAVQLTLVDFRSPED
jgi:single-stranded-DNA-specific exonuclease